MAATSASTVASQPDNPLQVERTEAGFDSAVRIPCTLPSAVFA
jgi:hypothetical protein